MFQIEMVKLFMNVHLSETWIRWTKCRCCHRLENFLPTPMQLIDVRNDPFFSSIVSQKQLGRVLAICLQILYHDRCQSHQNNLSISIFVALWIWIFCSNWN